MKNLRATIRTIAAVAAVSLIGFGIIQPIDQEVLWLICLWAAVPLVGIAVWLSQPPLPRGLGRNVYAVGIVVALGFGAVSMQLLRQQVVQAAAIYERTEIDPESGQITSNVRPVLKAQRVVRGNMFDRDGALLVGSEVVEGGFVRRTYPVADQLGLDPAAFSNIVGFFSNRFGWSGLEATHDDYLSGERGRAFARLQSDLLGQAQEGSDLHLTIDAQLQARATALLGGRYGSVVVLDPRTGAILAMASVPGFDPRGLSFNYGAEDWEAENARVARYWEQLQGEGAGQPLLNRPTQGQYPPGSTFKTVTAVAALEYPNVGRPNDIRCFNELQVETGAPPVVNAVDGLMSLTGDPSNLERVYAYSCNVAFAQYALRLNEGDANLLEEVAMRFDIFTPLNTPERYRGFTDLATAPSRLYVEPNFLERPAAQADTGYGQGQLLVTPLQMALVAAAIANDGVMPQPYLVERITEPEGSTVYDHTPRSIRRTMSPETAAEMREHMRAVGQYGFGRVVNDVVPGVVVGGKSGTGEHVPGEPPHAWFIAAAPIDEPRYVVSVMIERGGEGSSVGASLAGQVLAAAFALETE